MSEKTQEQLETLEAIRKISEGYTKEELIEKVIEFFNITSKLVDLLRVLAISSDDILSAVQLATYNTASERKARADARKQAKWIVYQYDQNIANQLQALIDDPENLEEKARRIS